MPTYRNAREFVEAVVQRYRALNTYSDTGKSYRPHCRRERLCLFATDYQSPSNFRFAFESPHPYRKLSHRWTKAVVGVHGARPYFFDESYSGDRTLEEPEDLDLAIAGATGISSGTAHTIAALLFPGISGFTLSDLRRLRFRMNRVIDGVNCTAVSGIHPRGGRLTAWFGEEDLLLRRLTRTRFRSEELRTNVRAGHILPEGLFAPPRVEA
jgi:hypothetical protein